MPAPIPIGADCDIRTEWAARVINIRNATEFLVTYFSVDSSRPFFLEDNEERGRPFLASHSVQLEHAILAVLEPKDVRHY